MEDASKRRGVCLVSVEGCPVRDLNDLQNLERLRRKVRSPEDAERLTVEELTKVPPRELLRYLFEAFGGRVTTASLGRSSGKVLSDWMEYEKEPGEEEVLVKKVQVLFRITFPLVLSYSVNTAAAFLQG